tara:strand:- start:15083 stop:17158 length:2076 start_codon:yes stop_codon:yes gene_type:complete
MPLYVPAPSEGLPRDASDNVVINEDGADLDFRIESNDETHVLFIDAGNNRVSIGDSTDAPTATLEVTNHVSSGASGVPLLALNSNDPDKSAVVITATHDETAPVINSVGNYLMVDTSDTEGGYGHIFQINATNSGTHAVNAASVRALKSQATLSSGNTSRLTGLHVSAIDTSSSNHSGATLITKGLDIIAASTDSTPTTHAMGLVSKATGANINDAALFFGKVVVSDTDTLDILAPSTTPGPNRNAFTLLLSGSDFADGMQFLVNDSSVTAGQVLGGIGFDSFDGNSPSSILESSAYIAAKASQDHGTDDKGGNLTFGTAPNDQSADITSFERMIITSEGSVGIGVSSPTNSLEINTITRQIGTGNLNTSSINRNIVTGFGGFQDFTTELSVGSRIRIGTEEFTVASIQNANQLTLSSDFLGGATSQAGFTDNNALTVTNSGDIGIGTTTPKARLEIEDNNNDGILGIGAKKVLLKVTADDENVTGLVIGNDTYSPDDEDGLAFSVDDNGLCKIHAAGNGAAFYGLAIEFLATEKFLLKTDNGHGVIGIGTTAALKDPDHSLHAVRSDGKLIRLDDEVGELTITSNTVGGYKMVMDTEGEFSIHHHSSAASTTVSQFKIIGSTFGGASTPSGNRGHVAIGPLSGLPASKLTVTGGDIEVEDNGDGLILSSPNGTRYRITVDDSGNLSTSAA